MASRKRKKVIDEGPFLFSEEEMLGMIENVTIIQTPEPPKETKPSENVEVSETKVESSASLELSSDERIVVAMTNVLWQMKHMDKSQIRRIAFSITVMCQQGLELNRSYSVPVIQDDELSGYELAAWCYCTFMSAFPSMQDKLQLPYAEHYNKAMESLNLN